jgi:hypothetical protein
MIDLIVFALCAAIVWLLSPTATKKPRSSPESPPDVPVCPHCGDLARRLHWALASNQAWEGKANAYRESLPELHAILCRVRDHHLPGWKLDDCGMCPICVESKLFERVEKLFGPMSYWSGGA